MSDICIQIWRDSSAAYLYIGTRKPANNLHVSGHDKDDVFTNCKNQRCVTRSEVSYTAIGGGGRQGGIITSARVPPKDRCNTIGPLPRKEGSFGTVVLNSADLPPRAEGYHLL